MFHRPLNNNRYEEVLEKLALLQAQLSRIEKEQAELKSLIVAISERTDTLMSDRGALDAAIATLSNEIAKLLAFKQSKTQDQTPSDDYTAEVAQLEQISKNITAAIADINAAAVSPDVPQGVPGASTSTTGAANSSLPPISTTQPTSSSPQEAPGTAPQS